jgi:LacI family xylobiose transport system transcriptional regulator
MPHDDQGDVQRPATLSRVAKEAAVSMSTVSKVLNGRSGVSDETRSRIEGLLSTHGYSRRIWWVSPTVEVVFSTVATQWAFEIIGGAERAARALGHSIVVTQSGDRHAPGPEWLEGVLRRRPAGIVLVFSDLPEESKRQLRVRNTPFVILDPLGDPSPEVPSVGAANYSGGLTATRHLIGLGHRRIGMVAGPVDMASSRARVAGYRSALEEAGIPVEEELIVWTDFHRSSGREGGDRLLAGPSRPTAIFATSDMAALGVYDSAREHGLEVPRDLSVIGFDDLTVAQMISPALTTIRQPLGEMAERAIRLVLRLRESNPHTDELRVDLATTLVVRDSTRAL